MIGPRYFDLQVNGYAGVDFNSDTLNAEQLHGVCQRLLSEGVGSILATIITADAETMARRLRKLQTLHDGDELVRQVVAGIQIEGPFLNETPGYRGAHPVEAIRPADIDLMSRLLDAAGDLARLVTLAPERDPGMAVTRFLAKRGIVVSAGHTDASLDDLRRAIDAGLTMFTHVGNGCPLLLPRHDNIIQRALSLSESLWLTFICDGVHVPWPALRNYFRAAGIGRCVVVTDAMAAAGLGPGRYTLGHWDLMVGDDMVARSPDSSHLVGSAGTMPRSFQNLIEHVGLGREEAELLTGRNPRAAIGWRAPAADK